MKNYSALPLRNGKYSTFRLIDDGGEFVEPFDHFVQKMIDRGFAPAAVTRYSHAVSQFLDYLTEVKVFGFPASNRDIKEAVDKYIPARIAGPDRTGQFIDVVRLLSFERLTRDSASNAAAAINFFLLESEYLSELEQQVAYWHGEPMPEITPQRLFKAQEVRSRSKSEIVQLMQKSMLASVVRWKPSGIDGRPGGYRSQKPGRHQDENNDFPSEYLSELLRSARSYRDRAVWALMAGCGLRQCEAAQITWDAIDIPNQKIFIYDPGKRRLSDQLPEEYFPRFKGRTHSETYFIPQLRDVFFLALEQYMKNEYRPGGPPQMVFQDIRPTKEVRAYSQISDKSRVTAFAGACKRAGVPERELGKTYTPHSLRHFYGVFMLNYAPVEGGYGLKLVEVQRLMGHASIATTQKYAREDRIVLNTKLALLDQFALNGKVDVDELRRFRAKLHQDEAERLLSFDREGNS